MAGEWAIATIEEVSEKVAMGPFGSSIKVETFVPNGIPVISGQHLHGHRLDDTPGFNFITPEHAERLRNANVQRGDVIFTHAGNIGQVAYIPESSQYDRYVISQRQFYMRPNRSRVIPELVTYYFKSTQGRHRLLANASQVGVPSLAQPVTYLRTIEMPVPPLGEQRAITHILGTLDDKIELNRRMNETLEAMARAIFKSWFVDFDPVHAKAEGRDPCLPDEIADLFPKHLRDFELGEIPKGWRVGVLNDLTEVLLGGDWGADKPTADETEAVFCIRGADIPNLQGAGLGKMPVRYLKPSSLAKRRLKDGDLAIEVSGGSTTQSTGRPVLVSQALLNRLDHPLVCSNFCRVVKLKYRPASSFVYLWLRELYDNDKFLQYENGTTGIKNFALSLFSEKFQLVIPPTDLLEAFAFRIATILERQQCLGAEAGTLAALRNTLLPKLISGELHIDQVEAFLASR